MIGIGEFFKRIQNSRAKRVLLVSAIREAVKKNTGIDVPDEEIAVRSGVVTLGRVSQSLRSVVYVRKQALLNDINAMQGFVAVTDIR